MSSLPIHVVSGEPDPPEPLKRFSCEICGRVGEEEYPDASSYRDVSEDRAIQNLPYAGLTPTDQWVCSQACRSQLMFQSVPPEKRLLLKRYELALSELIDLENSELPALLSEWDCGSDVDDRPIYAALKALGEHFGRWKSIPLRSLPRWIEANEPPQDVLREAIRKAISDINYGPAQGLRMAVDFQNNMIERGRDFPHGVVAPAAVSMIARAAGSLAGVVGRLKSSVDGVSE